jgi:hypothetical protein
LTDSSRVEAKTNRAQSHRALRGRERKMKTISAEMLRQKLPGTPKPEEAFVDRFECMDIFIRLFPKGMRMNYRDLRRADKGGIDSWIIDAFFPGKAWDPVSRKLCCIEEKYERDCAKVRRMYKPRHLRLWREADRLCRPFWFRSRKLSNDVVISAFLKLKEQPALKGSGQNRGDHR